MLHALNGTDRDLLPAAGAHPVTRNRKTVKGMVTPFHHSETAKYIIIYLSVRRRVEAIRSACRTAISPSSQNETFMN